MRLTIVPVDGTVIVDGVVKYQPLDLSSCGVPSEVHALQWYGTRGWIEFNDDADPFTPKAPNEDLSTLPAWAEACVAVWDAWSPPAPPVVDPALAQPTTTGTQTL